MALSRDILTPGQAAVELGVHHATIRKWISTGALPAVRVGGRLRIRRRDVRRFVQPAVKPLEPETIAV